MCVQHLWNYPLAQLEAAATNFADFRLARQRRLNAKWQRVAKQVDQHARFWFPAMYAMAMAMVFALDIEDMYQGPMADGQFAPQQPLLDAMRVGRKNSTLLIAIPVAFVGLTALPLLLLRCVLLPAQRRQAVIKAASASATVKDRENHSLKRQQTSAMKRESSGGTSRVTKFRQAVIKATSVSAAVKDRENRTDKRHEQTSSPKHESSGGTSRVPPPSRTATPAAGATRSCMKYSPSSSRVPPPSRTATPAFGSRRAVVPHEDGSATVSSLPVPVPPKVAAAVGFVHASDTVDVTEGGGAVTADEEAGNVRAFDEDSDGEDSLGIGPGRAA